MSYQDLSDSLDLAAAPFLARLTDVNAGSGSFANLNLYSFIEQMADPTTGIPNDAAPGRQTEPALTGTPTSGFALEVNNVSLTVPGSTPSGYANPGPYVTMRLKGFASGVPVYEFVSSSQIAYLTSNVTSFSLSGSWANIGTSLTLPANSTWLLQAQINAQIVSSSSGADDTISCRFYDGTSVAGCPVEFCDAVCDSLTYVDAASLVAVYTAGNSGATINIQGIVNTSTGSTGTILGCGSLAGGQLVGVRLS